MRSLGSVLVLCWGLLGAATPRAAERLPLVPLDGPGLKRLCDSLRPDAQVRFRGNEVERGKARAAYRQRREAALARFYVTEVPAKGFAFQEYDLRRKRLAVSTRKAFALHHGPDLALGETEEEPELVASLAPRSAEQVARLRREGKLVLRLIYRVDPGARPDPCQRTSGGRARSLTVDPLVFELVAQGRRPQRHYRGELPGYVDAVHETLPVVGPRVRIPRVGVASGDPPKSLVAAARRLETPLLACYRQGLETNARLRGAVVVGVSLDGNGTVVRAHAQINSLGDDAVVACTVAKFKRHRFPKGLGRVSPMSVPVYFQSQDD